jgi:hypothetical protein
MRFLSAQSLRAYPTKARKDSWLFFLQSEHVGRGLTPFWQLRVGRKRGAARPLFVLNPFFLLFGVGAGEDLAA